MESLQEAMSELTEHIFAEAIEHPNAKVKTYFSVKAYRARSGLE